jgi:adenylate cyclase
VVQQTHLRHGFLAEQDQIEVRVRIRDDKVASLTLKISTCDLKRAEFAFDTGLGEADALLEHCKGAVLEKMLYTVLTAGRTWLVDEHRGKLAGLTTAEIALGVGDNGPDPTEWPGWIAEDVTADVAYSNVQLATNGLPPSEKPP